MVMWKHSDTIGPTKLSKFLMFLESGLTWYRHGWLTVGSQLQVILRLTITMYRFGFCVMKRIS